MPKGVMLSHENICSNLHGLKKIWTNNFDNQRSLAFLPWSHLYGQVAELHALVATGSQLAIVTRDEILECLPIVKPTVILSVPILFNKVYSGVLKRISNAPPLVQKLFGNALKVARHVNSSKEMGVNPGIMSELLYKLYDKIVFQKIRMALGGRVRFMGSGGAAVSLPVLHFFEDIGIPICEGYGLTETSPVITTGANNWQTRRLGCSGVALYNVKVRIIDPNTMEELPPGEEGEVCCAGPNVMVGYHNNQKANDEVTYHVYDHVCIRI
jgi:long-chain acyl-CoA synthetase